MPTAFLQAPGSARTIQMGATSCTFHIIGKDTDGQIGMFELTLEPGARGAGLHLHKHLTELFYVVEGEVALVLNQEQVQASAGATMLVPPETPHAFSNPGSQPAKLLFVFWPPEEREQFFEGLLELAQQNASQNQMLAFMEQFDQYPVPDDRQA